jgi:adhesin/invasin
MRKLLAAAAVALAACSSQVSTGSLPCTSDATCPAGAYCLSGSCAQLPGSYEVTIDPVGPITVGKTVALVVHAVGGVTWSVQESGGGTVDANGTYTAPATPGTYHAVATSTADSTKSSVVAIVVVPSTSAPQIGAPHFATRGKSGLTAQVASPSASLTYAWTATGGTLSTAATGTSVTFTAGTGATVMLSCIASNAAGDPSAPGSATVTLVDAPVAAITAPSAVTARKSGYVASVAAQPDATYAWSATGGTITAGASTNSITFTAGTGASVMLSVQVTNQAGDSVTGTLSPAVVDAVNEPVLAGDGLVSGGVRVGAPAGAHVVAPASNLTYAWTIEGGTFSGSGSGSSATGTSVTYAGAAAGSLLLTCTASNTAGDSANATLTVKLVGAAIPTSLFTASGSPALADGQHAVTLSVALVDLSGNAVFNDPIVVSASPALGVTFTGVGATTDGQGRLNAVTGSDGTYSFSMTSTSAGAISVQLAVDGTQLPAQVDFLSGTPNAASSVLTSDKSSTVADGVRSITFTAIVRDVHSNPVQGAQVQFQDGGANAVGASALTTDVTGIVHYSLKTTAAGPRTVTAMVGQGTGAFSLALSGGGTVTFLPGDPDSGHSTITPANGASGVADNSTQLSYLVKLADAFGNATPGAAISVAVSGSNNTLSATSGASDTSGAFSVTLKSKTAEAKTITFTVVQSLAQTNFNLVRTATFTAAAPAQVQSTIAADVASITASNGTAVANLTVTIRDQFNNPVGGAAVQFTSTGSGNTFSNAGAATSAANGTATSAISSTKAELKTLAATVGTGASAFTLTLATSIAVTAAAPDSGKTTIAVDTTQNASLVADNLSPVTYTATVRDQFSNLEPGVAVLCSASGSANTLSAVGGTTTSSGTFAFSLKTKKAELKTINLTDSPASVLSASVITTFIAGPPAASNSGISVDNLAPVASMGQSFANVTVTLFDAFGNPAPNAPVQFASSGSGNTFSNGGATTSSSAGGATATFSSTTAEKKTITAKIGIGPLFTLTFASPVVVSPAAADSSHSTLAVDSDMVVANNTAVVNYTATIKDSFGNPIPSLGVAATASGSNNTLLPGSGSTSAIGVFTFSLATKTAEAKTVKLTDNPTSVLSVQVTSTFVAGAPSSGHCSFSSDKSSVGADGVSAATLTTTVKDQFDNLVVGASVVYSGSGSQNVFAASSGSTNASGVYSTTVTSTLVQSETVSSRINNLFNLTSLALNFVPGDPNSTNTTLSTSIDPIAADGTTTTTITLFVADAGGHAISGLGNINLAVTGSGNTFSFVAPGTTDSAGKITATLKSTVAENKTITATVPQAFAQSTLTKTLTAHFVVGAPASGTSTITGPTSGSTVADGAATVSLTVLVEDAKSNPVPGVQITFASSGSNNAFVYAGGISTTDATGKVMATLSSITAENKTVTAAVGQAANPLYTLTLARALPFVAGDPDATQSTLTTSQDNVVADGSTAMAILLTVKDKKGNVVPSLAGVSLTATSTLSNNSFSPGTVTSAIRAEQKSITATIPKPTAGGTISKLLTVTFIAGAPVLASSTFTATPASPLTANGTAQVALLATLKDGQGNPAIGSVTFSASTSSGGDTFTPSGATAANGTGQVSGTMVSTASETKQLQAAVTSAGASFTLGPVAAIFTPGDPDATQSTLAIAPTGASPVVADGTSTFTITLTVKDTKGNLLKNQGGVTLTSDGSNNTFVPAASGGTVSGATNGSGVFTATLSSIKAQTKNLTATVNKTLTAGTITETGTATFIAGVPVAANSALSITPAAPMTANGVAQAALLGSLADAKGNPVSGATVTFSAAGSTASTFTPPSAVTNSSGAASSALTSTYAETKSVTATVSGSGFTSFTLGPNSVTFTPGDPDASNTTLNIAPTISGSPVADGTSTFTIVLTVKDAKGNLMKNLAGVSLSSDGVSNTFNPSTPSGSTDASGQFTVTLASIKAQTKNLTATVNKTLTAGTITETGTATFIAGPPTLANTTLTASPSALVADGNAATTLTLTTIDAQGNAATPCSVAAPTSSDQGTGRDTFSGTTIAGSVYTSTLKSTLANASKVVSWPLVLTCGGATVTKTVSVNFTAGPVNGGTSTITPAPTVSVTTDSPNNSVSVVATFLDVRTNPISGSATVTVSGSGNTFSPGGPLDANGRYSFSLSSTKAEFKTVAVTANGLTLSTTVKFIAGAPSASASSFVVAPAAGGILADGAQSYTLTLSVLDANGNFESNLPVTFSAAGSHNAFSPASGNIAPNGTLTTSLSSYTAQTEPVTANVNSGALVLTKNVTFIATPWQPVSSIYGARVTGIVFDPTDSSTVYVSTHTGVMKSSDNGANWALLNSGMEKQHAFKLAASAVSGIGTVLVTLAASYQFNTPTSTLYRSIDGGNSWTLVNLPAPASFVASGGNGVFVTDTAYSTDGANWNTSSLSGSAPSLTAAALLGSKLIALNRSAAGPEVVVSSNGGQTWTAANAAVRCGGNPALITVDGSSTTSVWYTCANAGALYHSTDGGVTFVAASTNLPTFSGAALTGDPQQSGHLIIGDTYGEVFETTNSGASWSASPILYNYYVNVAALAFDPSNHNNIWVGSSESYQWGDTSPGISIINTVTSPYTTTIHNTGMQGAGINQVEFTSDGTAWAWSGGLYKSIDGRNWTALTPFPGSLLSDATFNLAPNGGSTVYAMPSGNIPYRGAISGSTISWTHLGIPGGLSNSSFQVAASNQISTTYALGYTGSGYQLFSSNTQGTAGSWVSLNVSASLPNNCLAMQVSPVNKGTVWIIGYDNNNTRRLAVYASGATYNMTFASLPNTVILDQVQDGNAYVGGGFGIVKVTGYNTVTALPSPPSGYVSGLALDAVGKLYALTVDGFGNPTVYSSFNNGTNWTLATGGLFYGPASSYSNINLGPTALAASPNNPGLLLMGSDRGGLFYTTSGGK